MPLDTYASCHFLSLGDQESQHEYPVTCEVGATSLPLKVKFEVSYLNYKQVFIIYYHLHFLLLQYHQDITCFDISPYPHMPDLILSIPG